MNENQNQGQQNIPPIQNPNVQQVPQQPQVTSQQTPQPIPQAKTTPQPQATQVVNQPTKVTTPPVNTVANNENKPQKKKSIFLILLIIFLFAFVFFLPDITGLLSNLKSEDNEPTISKSQKSGSMRCYLTKEMTDIDYSVETRFTYEKNKLKNQIIVTTHKLKAQTQDQTSLLEKEATCQRLKTTLTEFDGMSASCKIENTTQEMTQEIDYKTINTKAITANIAELEGYYPSYELDQDITEIKTEMEQAGYTCTMRE